MLASQRPETSDRFSTKKKPADPYYGPAGQITGFAVLKSERELELAADAD